MGCRLHFTLVVLTALWGPGWGQWQEGVPAPSEPQTIRISVGNGALDAQAAPGGSAAPLPTGQVRPSPSRSPAARPPSQRPGSRPQPSMFGGFPPFFMDGDMFQDRICGMSRRPMGFGGAAANFWRFNMFANNNMFTCSCRLGEGGWDLDQLDPTPQARRDCMTAVTGMVCCHT